MKLNIVKIERQNLAVGKQKSDDFLIQKYSLLELLF